jgi:hypothetical protein
MPDSLKTHILSLFKDDVLVQDSDEKDINNVF